MGAETLIIEIHQAGRWHQAAELELFDSNHGPLGRTRIGYLNDYVVEHLEHLGIRDQRAVAEHYALGFETWSTDGWPAFLYDIVPSGAARRWWRDRLGANFDTEAQLDGLLLRNHTNAPIGHLRVNTDEPLGDVVPFTKAEVLSRDTDFLEYAAARGAAIGGATGAGGDAPKVLLAEDADQNVYPAGTISDEQTVKCWFVKWPRGNDTTADRIVLETEHHYAHALAELGLDVCPGTLHRGEATKPSLWLPRFDRNPTAHGLERTAVESLYSLAGIGGMGAKVSHQTLLRALQRALADRDQLEDFPELAREYVRRDLLDVVLGNSDNHGRNRALIRGERLTWAPIYDLAPMVLDPAGVTRSTTWEGHEYGGRRDWLAVCEELEAWIPQLNIESALRDFASKLLALPDMLRALGVDDAVMRAPRIYLADLAETLKRWGLR